LKERYLKIKQNYNELEEKFNNQNGAKCNSLDDFLISPNNLKFKGSCVDHYYESPQSKKKSLSLAPRFDVVKAIKTENEEQDLHDYLLMKIKNRESIKDFAMK